MTVSRMSGRGEHSQETSTLMSCLSHRGFRASLSLSDLFKSAQELHQQPYYPAALTFWLLPSFINLHHLDRSLCVASELHSSQVAAGGNCIQHALRQTLGPLHGAATTRPVRLPRVSFMTVTATFESSCSQTDRWEDRQTDMRSGPSLGFVSPSTVGEC